MIQRGGTDTDSHLRRLEPCYRPPDNDDGVRSAGVKLGNGVSQRGVHSGGLARYWRLKHGFSGGNPRVPPTARAKRMPGGAPPSPTRAAGGKLHTCHSVCDMRLRGHSAFTSSIANAPMK